MPVKFSCPHCKKPLSVRDELAGKQGRCPGCRQVIVIPQQHTTPQPGTIPARPLQKPPTKPPSKSNLDLEAMAAAALAEEKAAVQETVTVDFTCPWCDTELHLPAELAGRQAPCTNPECRRIVKVPQLKKTEPRDWRRPDQQTMPSGAKREDAPLEGAWGSQTGGSVSRQALVEAAVIKETREPITVRGWILRGTALAAVVGLVIAGGWWFLSSRWSSLEERGLQLATKALDGDLPPDARAVLETALAEHYQRSGKHDANDRPLGLVHLQKAREAAGLIAHDSPDKPFVLRDLLRVQLNAAYAVADQLARMPGNSQAKTRLETELADRENELADTLGMLPPGIVRDDVIRGLVRTTLNTPGGSSEESVQRLQALIQRGIKPMTIVRTNLQPAAGKPKTGASAAPSPPTSEQDYSDQLNALAVLGQELAATKQELLVTQAARLAETARRLHKPEHPVPWQLIALLIMLNRQELEGIKPGEPALAGQIAGFLRADRIGDANRQLDDPQLRTSTTPLKIAILLDAADVLHQKQQPDPAKSRLEEAAQMLEASREGLVWERCRLVELAAAILGLEPAEALARSQPRGAGPNRAKDALTRCRLLKQPAQPLPADLAADGFDATARGFGPAVLLIARQNARLDSSATVSWAESLPAESARPYAGIGAVLGMGDSTQK